MRPPGPTSASRASSRPATRSGSGNALHPPQNLARIRIQRRHGSARLAAFVVEIRARQRLGTRQGHVQPAVIIGRGGAQIVEAVLHLRLPQQFAIVRVNRISRRRASHEEDRIARARISGNRRDNGRESAKHIGAVGPVDASGLGVHRIDHAVIAADEHTAEGDRGLRIEARPAGKSKSPLELQPWAHPPPSVRRRVPSGTGHWWRRPSPTTPAH